MAAPSNAYRAEKLHDGTTTANSVKADIAIPNVSEATLKTRFYLDFLLNTTKDGVAGFVGGCTIGSDNYAMHNTARHWTGRGRGPSGQMIQWFNDAGLNTLGPANLGVNGFVTLWANYVRAHITFTAAWYVNTTEFGFEYRQTGASTWIRRKLDPSAIPQQQSITDTWRLPGSMIPDTSYQFRFYNVNDEGTYYTQTYTRTTLDYIYEEIFQQRTVACTLALPTIKLYMDMATRDAMSLLTDVAVSSDLHAWTDDTFSTYPPSGWYYSYDDGYSYFYNPSLGFTHRQFCEIVPTIKVTVSVTVFESGYWTAVAHNITGTNFGGPVTITGVAVGSNAGGPVANVPFSVTIPAGVSTGNNEGTHTADFVALLDWTAGGFSSSNPGLVANTEIKGSAGPGT